MARKKSPGSRSTESYDHADKTCTNKRRGISIRAFLVSSHGDFDPVCAEAERWDLRLPPRVAGRFEALKNEGFASLGTRSAASGLNHNSACMNNQVVPLAARITSFETMPASLSCGANHVETESRTLAALRDTLLPKLISGQIRLPAAFCECFAQAGVKGTGRSVGEVV